MTPADVKFTDTVLSFLAGDLDHCDEHTSKEIAAAAYRLDYEVARATNRPVRTVAEWEDAIALVMFEPSGRLL